MKATVVTHRHENGHAHEIRVCVSYVVQWWRDARGYLIYLHPFEKHWPSVPPARASQNFARTHRIPAGSLHPLPILQQQVNFKVSVSVLENNIVNISALWLGRD